MFKGGELIATSCLRQSLDTHICADSSVSGHSPGLEKQSLSVLSTRCDIFVGSTVPVRDWTHLIY